MAKPFDLRLLRSGDEEQWEKLYSFTWGCVLSNARKEDEAFKKDVTQEVMLNFIRNIDNIDHPALWIRTAVRNQIIDDTRPAKRLVSIHGSEENDESGFEEILAGSEDMYSSTFWKEQRALLWRIVADLPEEYRRVFDLTVRLLIGDDEITDTDTVARKLGITQENYFKRWSRCKEAIRNHPRSKDLVYGRKKRVRKD